VIHLAAFHHNVCECVLEGTVTVGRWRGLSLWDCLDSPNVTVPSNTHSLAPQTLQQPRANLRQQGPTDHLVDCVQGAAQAASQDILLFLALDLNLNPSLREWTHLPRQIESLVRQYALHIIIGSTQAQSRQRRN
jgi:hypothetical protein